jgi:biotin carboxyl carrier protein
MTSRVEPQSDGPQGDYWHEGEVFAMPERIVVAQARGRAYPLTLEEGERVRRGVVLAHLRDGDASVEVAAPVAGTLANWFVSAGAMVDKGQPLVAIRRLRQRRRRR